MAKTTEKTKLPDINKVLSDIVNDFNIKKGKWTLPVISCEKHACFITLSDGRKAEVQVRITTDVDDFIY